MIWPLFSSWLVSALCYCKIFLRLRIKSFTIYSWLSHECEFWKENTASYQVWLMTSGKKSCKSRIVIKPWSCTLHLIIVSYLNTLFCFILTAGAYYPAQLQYFTSVQPAPVMINLAEQQQQTPISQQPLPPSQGPPKTDRKQVVRHRKMAACLLSKVKNIEWSKSFYLLIADTFQE